jgi:glycosyltransferase involved in cell wall biosynthesis
VDAQLIGHVIARRAGVPHVTEEQGGAGIHRKWHHALAARMVAPRAARVVAVSESQLPDLHGLGYGQAAVRVIPNAVPSPGARQDRVALRRKLGVGEGDTLALLVSVLRPEKRADVFVEAVARARCRDPRIRGLIAGGGPQLDAIRALAAAAGDGIRALGERADIPELMGAADIVCLSSDVEGLPMTVLEAMASARPVIATDVGGVRDAVLPGRTGLLVERRDVVRFADALVELAANPLRAREMGVEGERVHRERFTIERRVDAYAEMLAELTQEPPTPDHHS